MPLCIQFPHAVLIPHLTPLPLSGLRPHSSAPSLPITVPFGAFCLEKRGYAYQLSFKIRLSPKLFSVNGGREGGVRSFRRSRSFRGLSELIGHFEWSLFAGVCFDHISGLYGSSLFLSLLAARAPEEDLSPFLVYFWLLIVALSIWGVHNVRNCVVNSRERSIEGKGLAVIN